MNFELMIRGDSFEEIATIFRGGGGSNVVPRDKVVTGPAEQGSTAIFTAKEVEPEIVAEETPAPKKSASRGRTKKETADTATEASGSTASPTSDTATAGTTAGTSTSDAEPVTFADLRAKTDEILQAGKVDSRAIQQMLIEKFDGAKAFGQVKEEDYARCLDELDKLAA